MTVLDYSFSDAELIESEAQASAEGAASAPDIPPEGDDAITGFGGTALDGLTPADDDFETALLVKEALERQFSVFAQEGKVWYGIPLSFGCSHAEIRVSHEGSLVSVAIDTGIRVPASHRDEANKLVLLGNSCFRLSGFRPLERGESAVVFAFDLDASVIKDPAGDLGEPASAGDDGQGEGALELCLGLALTTVRAYTHKFNAIAFGGRTALDAFED